MPYYVPLGVRGVILRVGAFFTGLLGSVVYWQGARRRAGAAGRPASTPHGAERPRIAA